MNEMKNVRLRAIEPEDLELLYLIENDMQLWNVGASNVPYSRYVLHDYIANTASDVYTDKQLRLIVENESREVVGIADLVNFDPRNLRAEVGIIIIDKYRNHGYGTATLTQLVDYAKNILNIHQLYSVIACSNEKCFSLFCKIGFEQSAVLKDWLCVSSKYVDAVLMTKIIG